MPTIANGEIAIGDIRKFLVINTTDYNGDGQYGVFVADTKDLEHYGIEPTRKQFEIVNTRREVSADDMGVGEVAESTDFHGAYLMRIA